MTAAAITIFFINVSRGTLIARPNCYYVLRELLTKGLIVKKILGRQIYFEANDPESLKHYIKKTSETVDQLIPSLKSLYFEDDDKIQTRHINDTTSFIKMLRDFKNSKSKIFVGPKPSDPALLGDLIAELQQINDSKSATILFKNELKSYYLLFDGKTVVVPISRNERALILKNKNHYESMLEMIKCFT